MITIREATTASELDAVRILVHALLDWLQQAYPEAHDAFEQDVRSVEAESLPGEYGPPAGRLLVARWDEDVAGTVAMRDVGGGACEMTRMFVSAKFRGAGIGRALATAVVNEARALGYRRMRLSTGVRQGAARTLYRSLGFEEVPPNHEIPDQMRSLLVCMQLRLC